MERYALLIGCNRGEGMSPLKRAEADVERVRAMLLRHAGWRDNHVVPLVGNVTPENIDHEVERLTQVLRPEDFLLVYYAGHAAMRNSELWLLLPGNAYPAQRLVDRCLLRTHQRGGLLALDCCQAQRAASSNFRAFFERIFPHGTSESPDLAGPRAIFPACATNEGAWENDEGGYFTTAFIAGCEHGGTLDGAHDRGVVNVSTLGHYIDTWLRAELHGAQRFEPVYSGAFDIKSTPEWRVRAHGSRQYTPNHFVMLPEETRRWEHTPEPNCNLISAHWDGAPLVLAAGCRDKNVVLAQVDQENSVFAPFNPVRDLAIETGVRGLKLSRSGNFLAVRDAKKDLILVKGTRPPFHSREYLVQADHHAILSSGVLLTIDNAQGSLVAWRQPDVFVSWAERHEGGVNHLRVSPSEVYAVTGGRDGKVMVCDLDGMFNTSRHGSLRAHPLSHESLPAWEEPFGQVMRVAVSADSQLVAAGFGGSGRVRVWQVDQPDAPNATTHYPQHGHFITALEFSPDGRYLASGCGGGQVHLTYLQEPTAPALIWHADTAAPDERITALAFSPPHRDPVLLIATSTGRLVLYQIGAPGAPAVEVCPAPTRGEVYRLSLLDYPDYPLQALIASASGIEAWDLVYP